MIWAIGISSTRMSIAMVSTVPYLSVMTNTQSIIEPIYIKAYHGCAIHSGMFSLTVGYDGLSPFFVGVREIAVKPARLLLLAVFSILFNRIHSILGGSKRSDEVIVESSNSYWIYDGN